MHWARQRPPGRRHGHHIGQQHRERLVADDFAGAPDRVAEAERNLLTGETRRAGGRKLRRQGLQFLQLAALFQSVVELIGDVEMILDDRLIAPGHEDKMLDSGLARFLDDMLKDRAIDDGQHLLGNRFGGREKPCSQTGDGKNSLANAFRHQSSKERLPRLSWVPCRAIRVRRAARREGEAGAFL